MKERSNLPQYGSCWKAAVQHLDEGCKHLSEESQSDIALHITNCFLEMSGHESYNCELDKKSNLRAICINNMSDRAFNVYTEFYTHTQNICWFLRGQIWQETISENTWKVGKQLELTAINQEGLLQAQKESLRLQEKMLKHGKDLEQVLQSLHASSDIHQNILMMLSKSVNNLQSWIIGEISWIDSVVFYMISVFVTFLLTSSQRTLSSRIPISVLLFLNLLIERLICSFITADSRDINILNLYLKIYDFVWYSRYAFVCLAIIIFLYQSVYHTDIHFKNNVVLHKIYAQNISVLNALDHLKSKLILGSNGMLKNNDNLHIKYLNESPKREYEKHADLSEEINNSYSNKLNNSSVENDLDSDKERRFRIRDLNKTLNKLFSNGTPLKNGYNLRSNSRQATPDC